MSKRILIISGLILLAAAYSHAFETKGEDCTRCHTLNSNEAKDLLKSLAPDIKILEIKVSPSKPLWEIFADTGGRKMMLYIDFSKKYLFSGSLFSITDRKNLTQESLNALNKMDLSQIPLEDALVMGDPKAKIRIVAFDDPD